MAIANLKRKPMRKPRLLKFDVSSMSEHFAESESESYIKLLMLII
jgi:hypothetical protein